MTEVTTKVTIKFNGRQSGAIGHHHDLTIQVKSPYGVFNEDLAVSIVRAAGYEVNHIKSIHKGGVQIL